MTLDILQLDKCHVNKHATDIARDCDMLRDFLSLVFFHELHYVIKYIYLYLLRTFTVPVIRYLIIFLRKICTSGGFAVFG